MNYLYQGDNLIALQHLQLTHQNKIQAILIDPPYNLQSNRFTYTDKLSREEWLTMMRDRLILAKNLLTDNGSIFVHISQHQHHHLRLLLDQVFGEKNFIDDLVWQQKKNNKYNDRHIATIHEYILIYSNNKSKSSFNRIPRDVEADKGFRYIDQYFSTRGKFKKMLLDDKSLRHTPTLYFPIIAPDGSEFLPKYRWRWSKNKINWGLANGFCIWETVKGKLNLYYKIYQFVNNKDEIIKRSLPYPSIITEFSNDQSAREIIKLFGQKRAFDHPKPSKLIQKFVYLATDKNSIVLDYFAGSGTTGQAVHQQNQEDGGNRTFILCQNNENQICENITKVRLEKNNITFNYIILP